MGQKLGYAKKCYILSIRNKSQRMYTLDGHILQQVQNNPYLGLQISEDLKWTTLITNVAKKANSTLGFLRRNLRFCPKECKKTAYISLVRSPMEYEAIVWYQVEGLVPAINPEFLVKSKPKRKIKPKRFDNFESYQFVKNNSKVLETTACNTEQYKNSFFVKSVIHWNQLEEEKCMQRQLRASKQLSNPYNKCSLYVELKPASGIFDVLIQIQGLVTTV